MISALFTMLVTALVCAALGLAPRWTWLARLPAVLGVAMALVVSLVGEVLNSGAGAAWPQWLSWLSSPVYRSDALSAVLGAWCLLLGVLCLLKIGSGDTLPWQSATGVLAIGTLYSLVHTWNLLAFAGQVLFLALLISVYSLLEGETDGNPDASRYRLALGLGAILLLGAVLIIGRTTGGIYDLATLSLSALTVWPLALAAAFVVLWVGSAPFTGWSSVGQAGPFGTLSHGLFIGVPAATLLLRLEALLSTQGLAGTVPDGWGTFTSAIVWLGAASALVAGAGMLLWAGTPRWTAMLTGHTLALSIWALGLDSPSGRYAALAILLAYGGGRVALELSVAGSGAWVRLARGAAAFSLAAAPVTPGFVGLWLLGAALGETKRPSLIIALAGISIVAACGVALHFAPSIHRTREGESRYIMGTGIAAAAALLAGGAIPALWLPQVSTIAAIAGGIPSTNLPWTGLQAPAGLSAPLTLVAAGALLLGAIGGLIIALARANIATAGVLLPTALQRLGKAAAGIPPRGQDLGTLRSNVPAFIWWLSLAWLETGVWGFGLVLGRLAGRAGGLLDRLEGRFYLPLAIVLALIYLLVVTR